MNLDRRRTLLFLLCAVVLLGTGFTWRYGQAYNRFYSSDAVLERELIPLDFDTRVLHYVNAGQQAKCRQSLAAQLRREIIFLRGCLESASADARSDADPRLQRAEDAIKGQTPADGRSTRTGMMGQ